MKWLRSNGVVLEVRDVGPVIFRLASPDKRTMIAHRDEVLDDDVARAVLRELLETGLYEGGKV